MMKVLLSAFACDPMKGSEAANGWNWAISLANLGYEVTCITREVNRKSIESHKDCSKISFIYVDLGMLEKTYELSIPSMYLYYLLWQRKASSKALKIHKRNKFDIVHHVTWGSVQLGSFMYKLKIPFVFGPVGGGQHAPEMIKKYFGSHWNTEIKRNKVSYLLERFNPGFKYSIKKCNTLLVANIDTYNLVSKYRSEKIIKTFDFALPDNFFPRSIENFRSIKSKFRLLWVGRFMPRKGIFLVLETMVQLKVNKSISLTIVGNGQLEPEISSFIFDNNLEDSVKFVGKVPYAEIGSYYSSHDAFFFTSLRDSCPVQLLEAMAYGLPVITIDLHGQSEIVNNENGIKVNVQNPEETISTLVKEIEQLQQNDQLYNKMRHGAFSFARQLTWEKKVANLTSLYY
jgi:glycosyltransferase involved in cell wall biosynthesis